MGKNEYGGRVRLEQLTPDTVRWALESLVFSIHKYERDHNLPETPLVINVETARDCCLDYDPSLRCWPTSPCKFHALHPNGVGIGMILVAEDTNGSF